GGIFGSAGAGLANLMIPIGMIVGAGGEIKDIVENSLKARNAPVHEAIINIHSEVSDAWKARIVRDIEREVEVSTLPDSNTPQPPQALTTEVFETSLTDSEIIAASIALTNRMIQKPGFNFMPDTEFSGINLGQDNEILKRSNLVRHIVKKTGLSKQKISDMVKNIKESKVHDQEFSTKLALEIVMKDLAVPLPDFYEDGTLMNKNDDRDAQDPLRFLDWFVRYRPNSMYGDSFRRVRSPVATIGERAWRTPFDRDPIISSRVKVLYEKMRSNSRRLKGNKPFYVVYALMQKRELYTGVILPRPIFEVGYATSPKSMSKIVSGHSKSLLETLKLKSNVYFRIAYFKSLKKEGIIPNTARFGDYFEAVPIDIAHTKEQMEDLETFYTIYVNRMNGRGDSFNLVHYNQLFNAIVGNLYQRGRPMRRIVGSMSSIPIDIEELKDIIFISKEHLDSAIELGLDKKDLYWYFRDHDITIDKILAFYYPGKKWHEIRSEVIKLHLIQLAKSGVDSSALPNHLYKGVQSSIVIRINYKDPTFQVDLVPYDFIEIRYLLRKHFGGMAAYNNLVIESYIKPRLTEMLKQGIITKERLIETLRGISSIPLIDPSQSASQTVFGFAFRHSFQMLFDSDIRKVLSHKDYGIIGSFVPIQLVKDLGLYIKGDNQFNTAMQHRLVSIIESMFLTKDLTSIFHLLNSGSL
ncbi:hypothetical protein LCGC14_2074470, partial [marine sediment metagenome]